MALPALESLHPLTLLAKQPVAKAFAETAAKTAPVRMAFLYVPNGIIPAGWMPTTDANGKLVMSETLQPLENIKDKFQVISGLEDLSANAGPDGGGDHARAGGTFLTGVRIKKTSGSDIHAGISIDQVVANQIGHLTRFPSLELSTDAIRKAGDCDSGYSCAYEYNLAWKSPNQPVTPETNPRLAFERLFGAGSPAQRAAALKQRQMEQHSILDYVMDDANDIQKKLSGRDQEKLDQYLTSVRELETRIQKAEQMPVADPQVEAPSGIPQDYAEHIQTIFDIMLLAFQTDSTRIATMIMAAEGNNRNFTEIGLSEGHHSLSHHQNNPATIAKVKMIDLWYVTQLGRFLQKMESTKDVDGNSLLHNSMIVYGSGNSDGNRHTHTKLPILLAGSGGGTLRPGRLAVAESRPITDLYLSMADRMGATGLERHGDSTGRLTVI